MSRPKSKKANTRRRQRQSREQKPEDETCHFTDGTLNEDFLLEAIKLPSGKLLNEWLAFYVQDLFKHVNKACGVLTPYCTPQTCPKMTAGPKFQWVWSDETGVCEVSAPQYTNAILTWLQIQFDDDELFPNKLGPSFPADFHEQVKLMMYKMFILYAHIYHHHFTDMQIMDAEAHLNTSFKYFIYFSREYSLIADDDFKPLKELIRAVFAKGEGAKI